MPPRVPKQSVVNIGLVGHVDHGKTTLAKALSGEWTDRHSQEIERGISIKLGYADLIFYKCPSCKPPECYTIEPSCPKCGGEAELLRRISLVDVPGHEVLMATMVSGTALMDGALLLIAADEKCPQPQTREHLAALEITGVDKIVVVQNKVELVSEKQVIKNYEEILKFIKGTVAENAPIIPISAMFGTNLDVLIQAIEETIPTPKRDLKKPGLMYIARSFDINYPGTTPENLRGGVVGGTIIQGKLKVGDELELRPGMRVKQARGKQAIYKSLITTVQSIQSGTGAKLKTADPGGLIGVGTTLDSAFTRADALIGNIAGVSGELPPLIDKITLKPFLLKQVVGLVEQIAVTQIRVKEELMLVIGTSVAVGVVQKVMKKKKLVTFKLQKPVCILPGQRVAISRLVEKRWRLIGWGAITEEE